MQKDRAVACLAALAHETRIDAFRLLVKAGPDGLPAGRIAARLGVVQNTMSAHLGVLARARLVARTRAGRTISYRADFDTMRSLMSYLLKDCCGSRRAVCAPLFEIMNVAC